MYYKAKSMIDRFAMFQKRTTDNPTIVELLEKIYRPINWSQSRGAAGTVRRHLYRDCVRAYVCTPSACYFIIKTGVKFRGIEYLNGYGFTGFSEVDSKFAYNMIKDFSLKKFVHKLPDKDLDTELITERI